MARINIKGRHVAGLTGALAIAAMLITAFESPGGQAVLHVYADPVSHSTPWTVCDGETAGIKPGQTFTAGQCDAMTAAQVKKVDAAVLACTRSDLPDNPRAAFDSLAWNIGTVAFCKSSIASEAKAGHLREACNRIPLYNRAGGKVIPGLEARRGQEQQICLEGLR